MNPEVQEDVQHPESWLGSFEVECLDELESEPNMEERLQSERELAVQHLWLMFQNSATAISQLYKDRHQGLSLWLPFQSAALAVTNLYKDSIDRMQHCVDLGQQCGRYHRTRDIVNWVRKKRRHIQRDELLAFLCGRTLVPKNRHGGPSGRTRAGLERALPRHSHAHTLVTGDATERNLDAFREAIALQGLDGAMSNMGVGYHPGGAQPVSAVNCANLEELNRFMHEEFTRNIESRKRSTASPDIVMDSPSRKRPRLL